MKTITSSY